MAGVLPTPLDCCASPCGDEVCVPTPLAAIFNSLLITGASIYNVVAYGADPTGAVEATDGAQAAIDAANSAGGGVVYFPAGIYLLTDLVAYSNLTFLGTGPGSVLKQASGATYILSVNPGHGGTSNPANNKTDISVIGLQFEGRSVEDGFSEHHHLLNINATTRLMVQRCSFLASQGDGIYLGSSNDGGLERHNLDITIEDCFFDGVNNDNRNAISVIDCTGLRILRNTFTRYSRTDMPGPIDLEPNDVWNRLIDIDIIGNRFTLATPLKASICMNLPLSQDTMTTPVAGIRILNNSIDGNGYRGIYLFQNGSSATTAPNYLLLTGNTCTNCTYPVWFEGLKDVTFAYNLLYSCINSMVVSGAGVYVYNLNILGNTLHEISTGGSVGIELYNVKNLNIQSNSFINVGNSSGALGSALFFAGTTDYVTIRDNLITGARTTIPIRTGGLYATTAAHNLLFANTYTGATTVQFDSAAPLGLGTSAPRDQIEVKTAGAATAASIITSFNSSALNAGQSCGFGFRVNTNFDVANGYSGLIRSETPGASNLSDLVFYSYDSIPPGINGLGLTEKFRVLGQSGADDDVAIMVARRKAGVWSVVQVTEGAADSESPGFRNLRVPN